jgi:transcriptional regulator with XRE-family HTH domain
MNLYVQCDALRALMAERGRDQRALAAATGVHASQINRLLNGRRQPGPHFVAGLMAAGIPVERVIGVEAGQ